MKKFILSIIVFLCVYPVANANNSNVKIKFIGEFEKSSQRPFIVTKKSLSGLGFELNHKLRETPFAHTDRGSGSLILEASTLGGQITNSVTSDITDVRKSVIEIGIRIDW